MTHVARRRLIVSVVGLVAVAAGVFLMRGCAWPTNNALIGQTEEVVRARYGVPEYEVEGHYGNPPLTFTQQFKGDVKSGKFWRLRGTLYVSFEKRGGQWIVISNHYLPAGAAF